MPMIEKRKRKNDEIRKTPILLTFILMMVVLGGFAFVLMSQNDSAQASINPNHIGIFVPHQFSDTDLGAVCSDGLSEQDITYNVAEELTQELASRGYSIERFFYYREVQDHRGDLFISLHVYGCFDDLPSGYRVAHIEDKPILDDCLSEYEQATGLDRLPHDDYLDGYYRFYDVAESSTVLTIEMGMLEADRNLLTNEVNKVVEGLANTITCISPFQIEE